jgi:putative CocE/NonD family hydrolase
VLIQTPYNRLSFVSRAGAELFGDAFAYVVVDMRGYGESRDQGAAWRSGGVDGYDAVEWIAAQIWSNGRVGTWGASAVGSIQYLTAAEKPPHLTCCVPIVRSLRNDYVQYFPGGVFREDYHKTRELALRVPHQNPSVYRNVPGWQTPGQPPASAARINVPMLFIGGWFDHNTQPDGYGILQSWMDVQEHGGDDARGKQRILIGPWIHTATDSRHAGELDFPAAERAGLEATERFYRYWLNGEDNGLESEPPFRYFVMGIDEWRHTETWPPRGVSKQTLFFTHDGSLAKGEPAGEQPPRCYDFDPADPCPTIGGPDVGIGASPVKWGPYDQAPQVEIRPDVLTFSTEPLKQDLVVLGAPKVRLFVSSDRTDTDVMVRLSDVYPDGRSILLLDTALRMRFRDSLKEEHLMTPGEVYDVTLDLSNTAVAFMRGHRIRVSVSSSNWPRFDVNPNTGGPLFDQSNPVVARNCVYADRGHPSALVLPVEAR